MEVLIAREPHVFGRAGVHLLCFREGLSARSMLCFRARPGRMFLCAALSLTVRSLSRLSWIAAATLTLSQLTLAPAHAQERSDDASSRSGTPRPRLTPRLSPRPPTKSQEPSSSQEPANRPTPPSKNKRETRTVPVPAAEKPAPARGTAPDPEAQGAARSTVPPIIPPVFPPPALSRGGAEPAFSPPVLQAYKRLPPPPGYVVRRSFNKPTFYGGAGTLVLTYSLALIYGAGNDFKNGMGGLAVPLLGPWLALGQRNFNCQAQISTDVDQTTQDVSKCITREAQAVGLLVGLGIGQLIGGVLVTIGLADQKKSWLRADLAGLQLELDAQVGPSSQGVVATGRF